MEIPSVYYSAQRIHRLLNPVIGILYQILRHLFLLPLSGLLSSGTADPVASVVDYLIARQSYEVVLHHSE